MVDFIDNREYGVALEWLYLLIKNRNLDVSDDQRAEISRLAAFMEFDLSKVK